MVEDKYVFDESDEEHSEGFAEKVGAFARFIWNSKTKEFCGRDGASWAKVSLFYGIFYTVLGGFFIGMLGVFYAVTPKDQPTYYGVSSVMNSRSAKLNPGLGFRPQIDPEDSLIKYDPSVYKSPEEGSLKYSKNLENFLAAKYSSQNSDHTINCDEDPSKNEDAINKGKSCRFDYEKLFKTTPCTGGNHFNYGTPNPCVLIKLNKIVSWKPALAENITHVSIRCNGENSFDVDNIKKVTYHSEGSLNNTKEGLIPAKYFPFWSHKQSSYRQPFIWAVFEVSENTLVNVECKAYAENIDNTDRLNRRGQTKFSLFVQSGKKNN